MAVYKEMGDWCDGQEIACWFGPLSSDLYISASVEPSGLVVSGNVDTQLFFGWVTKLCAKLTAKLGREVHDAEV